MHQLEQKISDFIHRHNLIGPQEQRIIVAISGGADSVALLAAMTALGYNCAAAHCNFHLRGEESDRDTRHVADICDRLGVDLSIKHFDIDARRRATGESVEMACRALRYEWFARLADSQQCRTVAVAHHLADNTETMLLNMMRGTGISGLTGMQPRNGLIIRPMLDCTRHEIESYLKERDIRFVNDSTNASNDYLRNRVRNIIIPAMENCFPNASHAMKHTMECLSDTERFYRQALEEKRNVYMSEDNSTIFLLRLAENEPMARLLLYEWIRPYGFNVSQASDMLTKARCGAEFTAGNTRIS
ncbi:MAG: tRNA lysidine(34) synthetase TilS, partial [Muribaculaceae bacterium]|nr:tRNA lysidine(34) synthetase TilS [Muribaculaceae bacterium]